MKKRLTDMVEIALDHVGQLADTDGSIANEYNGYVSSFGAAVINMGLIPAYYHNIKDKDPQDKKPQRAKMLDVISKIINQYSGSSHSDVMTYYEKNAKSELALDQIMDAAVALKLVIRTYHLKKKAKQ